MMNSCVMLAGIIDSSCIPKIHLVQWIEWLTSMWSNMREGYADFNADETGIVFRLTPDRTLKLKVGNVSGKLSKYKNETL